MLLSLSLLRAVSVPRQLICVVAAAPVDGAAVDAAGDADSLSSAANRSQHGSLRYFKAVSRLNGSCRVDAPTGQVLCFTLILCTKLICLLLLSHPDKLSRHCLLLLAANTIGVAMLTACLHLLHTNAQHCSRCCSSRCCRTWASKSGGRSWTLLPLACRENNQ